MHIAKEIKKITRIITIANKLKYIMQNIAQLAQVTSYIL
jgi:tRNA C32,U32 (ribose-2'-O)-methylase TrmJ